MWPRQRLVRQVPQALHEGHVALVEAWAHGEWYRMVVVQKLNETEYKVHKIPLQ